MYHLVINQAIHIPHLDHHLLCPIQCQVNDVIVDNTPIFLVRDLTDHMHALIIKDPTNPAQTFILPLELQGMTLLTYMRAPTLDKWNSDTIRRLHLTAESLSWDPTLILYEELDAAMAEYSGRVVMTKHAMKGHVSNLVINALSSLVTDQADIRDDNNFYCVLPLMSRS